MITRGGGCYNDDGLKTGKWIELHPNFYEYIILIIIEDCLKYFMLGSINQEKELGYGI